MAKGRIEQEIVVKVLGGKEVVELEKQIKALEKAKAEIVVDVDADEAVKQLEVIDKTIAELKGEKAEIEVEAKVANALDALDDVAKEAKQAEEAAEALSRALGPELTARANVDDIVNDFQRMGLTFNDISSNADRLAGKLREVGQSNVGGLDAAMRRTRTSVDDLGHSADRSRSVMANMVGNSSQDLVAMTGVAGAAGVAIGQIGEYATEGGIAISKLAGVAVPMLGLAAATQLISKYMKVIAETEAFDEERVRRFRRGPRRRQGVGGRATGRSGGEGRSELVDGPHRQRDQRRRGQRRQGRRLVRGVQSDRRRRDIGVPPVGYRAAADRRGRRRLRGGAVQPQRGDGGRACQRRGPTPRSPSPWGRATTTSSTRRSPSARRSASRATRWPRRPATRTSTATASRRPMSGSRTTPKRSKQNIKTIQEWAQAQQDAANEAADGPRRRPTVAQRHGRRRSTTWPAESPPYRTPSISANAPLEARERIVDINEAIRDLGEFIREGGRAEHPRRERHRRPAVPGQDPLVACARSKRPSPGRSPPVARPPPRPPPTPTSSRSSTVAARQADHRAGAGTARPEDIDGDDQGRRRSGVARQRPSCCSRVHRARRPRRRGRPRSRSALRVRRPVTAGRPGPDRPRTRGHRHRRSRRRCYHLTRRRGTRRSPRPTGGRPSPAIRSTCRPTSTTRRSRSLIDARNAGQD